MKRYLSLLLLVVIAFASAFFIASPIEAEAATSYEFLFPVNRGGVKIAYKYGYSSAYFDNTVFHYGIDIHSSTDQFIYAAFSGTVIKTNESCSHVNYGKNCGHDKGFGNSIYIQSKDGKLCSIYGHLKQYSILVKEGEYVEQGQPIATMGSSGWSTGKHLHFEVRTDAGKQSSAINVNSDSVNYLTSGYKKLESDCTHTFEYSYDGTTHWLACTNCVNKKPAENHNWELAKFEDGSNAVTNSYHLFTCKICEHMYAAEHTYESDCDASCDICQAERTVPGHQFQVVSDSETHWEKCTICGNTKPIENHNWELAKFNDGSIYMGSTSHWYECKICGRRSSEEHIFENDCDTTCDTCGYVRKVQHSFDRWDVNFNGHWKICSICGEKGSDIEPHNVVTLDSYTTEYHSGVCTICEKRVGYKHVYENDCDISCSGCEYERAVQHTYQNDCDSTCDICGQAREVEEHVYGDEYSYDYNGHWNVCSICGAKEPAQAHTVIAHSSLNSVYHKIDCSICKGNIAEKHIFDDENDKNCNDCGYEREIGLGMSKKNLVIGGTVGGVSLLGIAYIFLKKKH